MLPDHYTVPDGLKIRLIGYVRHAWDDEGHYITTLWRNPAGSFFYMEDFWTPYSPPFWLSNTLENLTPCTTDEFCDHVDEICAQLPWEEQVSAYYRYAELMTVWGVLEGIDIGFAWARENLGKF